MYHSIALLLPDGRVLTAGSNPEANDVPGGELRLELYHPPYLFRGPRPIIDRAPSAELRENQLDEDSLPPYSELDRVLEAYVQEDRSREELSADGFDPEVVERAVELIDRAEYKRRQAPPGVRLTPKAFGRDRRTPITNRWRG